MRTRALTLLTVLYFGPFLFLGPVLCDGKALVAEEPATTAHATAELVQLASATEPGEPMEIRGRLFEADGTTPIAGAEVFVYHTDIDGYYSGTTTNSDSPRIHATLTTDALGAYAFRSIRPGAYPQARVPAHVHYVVRMEGQAEQRRTLQFAGDPLLSARARQNARPDDTFSNVRPIERDGDGVWQVVFDLRLNP